MTRFVSSVLGAVWMLTGSAQATTWVDGEVKDPLSGKMVKVREIASYGGYIYQWPSKYDGVYWPWTDMQFIRFSPESGFAAYGEDFEKISEEEKKKVSAFLQKHFDKEHPPEGGAELLEWTAKVYEARGLSETFRLKLLCIQAYYHRANQEKAAEYRKKAITLAQKLVSKLRAGHDKAALYFLIGSYAKMLGDEELSRVSFDNLFALKWEAKEEGEPSSEQILNYFKPLVEDLNTGNYKASYLPRKEDDELDQGTQRVKEKVKLSQEERASELSVAKDQWIKVLSGHLERRRRVAKYLPEECAEIKSRIEKHRQDRLSDEDWAILKKDFGLQLEEYRKACEGLSEQIRKQKLDPGKEQTMEQLIQRLIYKREQYCAIVDLAVIDSLEWKITKDLLQDFPNILRELQDDAERARADEAHKLLKEKLRSMRPVPEADRKRSLVRYSHVSLARRYEIRRQWGTWRGYTKNFESVDSVRDQVVDLKGDFCDLVMRFVKDEDAEEGDKELKELIQRLKGKIKLSEEQRKRLRREIEEHIKRSRN